MPVWVSYDSVRGARGRSIQKGALSHKSNAESVTTRPDVFPEIKISRSVSLEVLNMSARVFESPCTAPARAPVPLPSRLWTANS
jgi:hypothetical protein